MPEDEEIVAVTVYVPIGILTRFRWEAARRSKPTQPVSPFELVASAVVHIGRTLPDQPPVPAGRRGQQEVREASRERRGGVGAHTEALRVIDDRLGASGRRP